MSCSVTDEYTRKGLDVVFLENDTPHVEVLAGKGADITEVRDKRVDENLLYESSHEWRPPGDGPVGRPDDVFAFLDHYPGGWQTVLPAAGGPTEATGAPLALHGESRWSPGTHISRPREFPDAGLGKAIDRGTHETLAPVETYEV